MSQQHAIVEVQQLQRPEEHPEGVIAHYSGLLPTTTSRKGYFDMQESLATAEDDPTIAGSTAHYSGSNYVLP